MASTARRKSTPMLVTCLAAPSCGESWQVHPNLPPSVQDGEYPCALSVSAKKRAQPTALRTAKLVGLAQSHRAH